MQGFADTSFKISPRPVVEHNLLRVAADVVIWAWTEQGLVLEETSQHIYMHTHIYIQLFAKILSPWYISVGFNFRKHPWEQKKH